MSGPAIGRRQRIVPSATAQIDQGHPISGGLAACYLSVETAFIDLCRNRFIPPTGVVARSARPTIWGKGTAQPCREASSHISSLGKCSGVTITVAFVPNTLTTLTNIFGMEHDSGPSCFLRHDETTASSLTFDVGADQQLNFAAGLVVNNPYVVTGRAAATTRTMWINGIQKATTASTETGTVQLASSVGNGVGIGCATDFEADLRNADDTIPIAIWHNRALTDAEIQQLAFDPFCFLRY